MNILKEKLRAFNPGAVTLLDTYEKNAFELEVKYLLSLDCDRLLRGFCDIAGIESSAERYKGWETSAIQGHTMGHYLTALSQAYAASGDKRLKEKCDRTVSVLSRCQNKNTGYLSAIPESHYIQLESGNTQGTWVPWYTMHKVMSGLISAYSFTKNPLALEVASKLGDWVYTRTSSWDEATQKTVLGIEYGGMNDCLYQLYSLTKSEKHLSAAHSFDELSLFEPLVRKEDILNGKHANTTIPKILGALRRFDVLGESESFYLQTAINFWDIVVNNHTYITGGNSEWEHFGESRILDAERTNCNCETCNTYNMLKLTRELFRITGEKKYSDYYESTFINAILSSQNPETGMTTYFQPMATGFFKVYSSAENHFWCCTGSGMENFSKLGDSIYFHDSESIYINRYTSSSLDFSKKGFTLTQCAELPDITFTFGGSCEAELVLPVPDWCESAPSLSVNGKSVAADKKDGFLRICGKWSNGDVVKLHFPMSIVAHPLPDNKNSVAFTYGPYVLSADLGTGNMVTSTTGVDVTVPLADTSISQIIRTNTGTVGEWLKKLNENFVPENKKFTFSLRNTDRNLVFSPHYLRHKSRYGIYFLLADANAELPENESEAFTVIDAVPLGNDQYEFSHSMKAEKSHSGNHKGLMFRDASPGGFFSYEMKVHPEKENYLEVRYYSGDAGRCFSILIDGNFFEQVTAENINPNGFYLVHHKIPLEFTRGKDKITVTFSADKNSYAGGIFEKLRTVIDVTE